MQKVRKAVIPAAGFATRFLPASKAMPKQMLPIVDKPVIQYIVEQLVQAGIEDIIIVTNYHEKTIEDHFDKPNGDLVENLRMGGEKKKHLLEEVERISELANFVYVRQKGPYGNGTPLLNVRHLVGDEPFIYTWSDEFSVGDPNPFEQLITAYHKYDATCLGCMKATRDEDYDRCGVVGGNVLDDGAIDVREIIEKPGKAKAPSDMLTLSPHVFTSSIFDYVEQAVKDTQAGKELYWNDVVKLAMNDGKRIMAVEIKDCEYCDSGTKIDYLKTVVKMAKQHPEIGVEFSEWLKEIA